MKRLNEYLVIRTTLVRFSIGSVILLAILFSGAGNAKAQSFSEGFDVVSNTSTPLPNWVAVNNSTSIGTVPFWFQGNPLTFPSHTGATNSYIGANFNNTTGADDISNWLITPNRTFNNGDTVTFYTRCPLPSNFPDRLQVRLSTNGTSTNVGSGPTGIGDFTNLLLDINPTLVIGGYPNAWTLQTITLSGLAGPTSGRLAFRYFVTDAGPAGANSNYIGIDTFAYTSVAPAAKATVDYNGDGKTDYSVVRNTGGGPTGQVTWYNCYNGVAEPGCYQFAPWGIATDHFVPADFDGDGKADIAIWRPAAPGAAGFYIFQSLTGTVRFDVFGQTGDDPSVTADYTGDGKADPAVYRGGAVAGDQSFWYYRASNGTFNGQIVYEQWGQNGDFPVPGDFDGDGKSDFLIQRNGGGGVGLFWLRTGSTNVISNFFFGTPTDVVVPGDYDGDGKADVATVRGSGGSILWYVRTSSAIPPYNGALTGFYAGFGASATDFPVQGDYDGDGKTDVAVWRPAVDSGANYFHALGSTSGYKFYEWGQNGDYPVANYNAH